MSNTRFFGEGPKEAQVLSSTSSSTPFFDQSQTPVGKISFNRVHCADVNAIA